jgi:hypothetical protein
MEGGLKLIFLVCAAAMLISTLMILTIPELSLDANDPE